MRKRFGLIEFHLAQLLMMFLILLKSFMLGWKKMNQKLIIMILVKMVLKWECLMSRVILVKLVILAKVMKLAILVKVMMKTLMVRAMMPMMENLEMILLKANHPKLAKMMMKMNLLLVNLLMKKQMKMT